MNVSTIPVGVVFIRPLFGPIYNHNKYLQRPLGNTGGNHCTSVANSNGKSKYMSNLLDTNFVLSVFIAWSQADVYFYLL